MKVKFKKLSSEAVEPRRAHASDAGFDFVAISRTVDENGAVVYGTGIAVEIPSGYVGLAFPRSSIAKKDLVLSNCVGVIDSGYRGEVMAKFKLLTNPLSEREEYQWYAPGERVFQMLVVQLPEVEFEEAEELSESDRGEGGYGSTGR